MQARRCESRVWDEILYRHLDLLYTTSILQLQTRTTSSLDRVFPFPLILPSYTVLVDLWVEKQYVFYDL